MASLQNLLYCSENADFGRNFGLKIPKDAISCYGRPLLQAWLLPYLNTISNNYIGKNSL